jgi:predicted Fe-S protein YdhL (DUF1289 family)
MKPIHKLNNGRGATLCHTCSVIITTGLTEELYCEKCKPKQDEIMERFIANAKQQETLEEVAERLFKEYSNNTSLSEGHYDYMMDKEDFKEASLEIAKWQQERSYSEEEVYDLMDKRETFWVRYKNTYSQNYISLKEWFEQFKNK